MKSVRLPAYAKVNLGLSIMGKRADGYHEIETVMHQIQLHDIVQVSLTDGREIVMRCNDSRIPIDGRNLCCRAARAIEGKAGYEIGVDIQLTKNIPVGAGLGGGSSDAAAVLRALNKLLQLQYSRMDLEEMAARLGSDVPFFVGGEPAIASGRGEKLQKVDFNLGGLTVVVVYPGVEISTTWAYSKLNLNLTIKKKKTTLTSYNGKNVKEIDFPGVAPNDFEEAIFPSYPHLLTVKQVLLLSGAVYASLSGSGSVVFGVFDGSVDVGAVKKMLSGQGDVYLTQFVSGGNF